VPCMADNPVGDHRDLRADQHGQEMETAKLRLEAQDRWQQCFGHEDTEERIRRHSPDLLGQEVVSEQPERIGKDQALTEMSRCPCQTTCRPERHCSGFTSPNGDPDPR
jgi:hypothetical protein